MNGCHYTTTTSGISTPVGGGWSNAVYDTVPPPPTVAPTVPPSLSPTLVPSSSPTLAPTSAPVIPYTIVTSAPSYPGGSYPFSSIATQGGGCWLGPDRQDSDNANGGDPSFFFVLNLGQRYTVESLKFLVCPSWCGEYNTNEFQVSMSDDGVTYTTPITVTTAVGCPGTLQTLPVGLTGRYLKALSSKYAAHSTGADYIAPFGYSAPTVAPTKSPTPLPTPVPVATYVKIVHNNHINICEVHLYYQGQQIPSSALTAAQSNNDWGWGPTNLIDSNTGTCCATQNGPSEWVLITATGPYASVDKVVIYNPYISGRINGATLMVSSDATFNTVDWQATMNSNDVTTYTKPGSIPLL